MTGRLCALAVLMGSVLMAAPVQAREVVAFSESVSPGTVVVRTAERRDPLSGSGRQARQAMGRSDAHRRQIRRPGLVAAGGGQA